MSLKDRIELQARSQSAPMPVQSKLFSWGDFSTQLIRIPDKAEFNFKLQSEKEFVILDYVVRSDGETFIDDSLYSQRRDLRDRITYVQPGAIWRGWMRTERGNNHILIVSFEQKRNTTPSGFNNLSSRLYFDSNDIRSTLVKIRDCHERGRQDQLAYARALGEVLRYELAWELTRDQQPNNSRKPLQGGLSAHQLHVIVTYFEENFSSEISIAHMSNLLNISKSHLMSAFKKSTGMSPYQYILKMRVDQGANLMNAGRMPLFEIAKAVGFRTHLQFNRAFRRFYGVAPRDFRRDQIFGLD